MKHTENDFVAGRFLIELKRCEVSVHMKTLKGGYADVIIIGEEIYDLLIDEIREKLDSVYGDKLIKKSKMYNPMIRYIWFGDNEFFRETSDGINLELELDTEIEDQERQMKLKREYLVDDFDNDIIERVISE